MTTKIPSVLSFNRSLVISDGLFYSHLQEQDDPINIERVGWRGVQNENKKNDKNEVNNIGEADIARLSPKISMLVVNFSFRPIDVTYNLSQIREEKGGTFLKEFKNYQQQVKNSSALDTLALRVATNIANGRWLWRNRLEAEDIKINVMIGTETYSFNANEFSLQDGAFEYDSDDLIAVATAIAARWKGESKTPIKVSGEVEMGVSGCEVYPSQAYISNPPKINGNPYGRALYKLAGNQAAFRDAKIWNALRTIDTWYNDYPIIKRPIAVEPSGASLDLNEKMRRKIGSLKTLLKDLPNVDPDSDDGLFVTMCVLIQGGVFSEKG